MKKTDDQRASLNIRIPSLTERNEMLRMEVDYSNPHQVEMAKLMNQVEATHPQTVQEFFIRLNDLCKSQNK